MVRSGLGKTQLAVRSVALSAPLLAVSTLPMKIASPYVDVHTLGASASSTELCMVHEELSLHGVDLRNTSGSEMVRQPRF